MKIIYLHGFNSAFDPSSSKVFALSELGEVTGINYDSFSTYDEIFEYLSEEIETTTDTLIVGASLGGFWAATMGKHFHVPSVIINPCHNPFDMMKKFVGETYLNYVTGKLKHFDKDVPPSYKDHELLGYDESFMYKPLVLIDADDEIIDSSETEEILRGFKINVFEEGSHRFLHMNESLNIIRDYVNEEELQEISF